MINGLDSHILEEVIIVRHCQVFLHYTVRLRLNLGDLQVGLHLGLILYKCRVVFGHSFIDYHGRLDARLINLSLHINNNVLLGLLDSDALLDGDVGRSQGIFVLLWQVGLTQLERLHPRIAFPLQHLIQFDLHIRTYCGQVSEEHTSCKLGGLVVQAVDGKTYTRTLIILTILQVKRCQIISIQLILEDGPEVNHEPILGSGLNKSTISIRTLTKVHGLHLRGVLNELMHEAYEMVTGGLHIVELLCYWGVVDTVCVNGKRGDGQGDINNHTE